MHHSKSPLINSHTACRLNIPLFNHANSCDRLDTRTSMNVTAHWNSITVPMLCVLILGGFARIGIFWEAIPRVCFGWGICEQRHLSKLFVFFISVWYSLLLLLVYYQIYLVVPTHTTNIQYAHSKVFLVLMNCVRYNLSPLQGRLVILSNATYYLW